MKTVRPIRAALGMSQATLAALLGVAQSSVSAYERGAQEISPDVARRLVKVSVERNNPVTLDQIYGLASLPGAAAEELATAG